MKCSGAPCGYQGGGKFTPPRRDTCPPDRVPRFIVPIADLSALAVATLLEAHHGHHPLQQQKSLLHLNSDKRLLLVIP